VFCSILGAKVMKKVGHAAIFAKKIAKSVPLSEKICTFAN